MDKNAEIYLHIVGREIEAGMIRAGLKGFGEAELAGIGMRFEGGEEAAIVVIMLAVVALMITRNN